jgi:hypothetical protein
VFWKKKMASSSVSQEDVEAEFHLLSRRSKIRTARARNPLAFSQRPGKYCFAAGLWDCIDWHLFCFPEQEMKWKQKIEKRAQNQQARLKIEGPSTPTNAQRGNFLSLQETLKKCLLKFSVHSFAGSRPNYVNKGKLQRDRRKLREKRRSTGVVHLQSTEVNLSKVNLFGPFTLI